MLEVKIAEVSKTLVDQLGASIGAARQQRQLDLRFAVEPAERQPQPDRRRSTARTAISSRSTRKSATAW